MAFSLSNITFICSFAILCCVIRMLHPQTSHIERFFLLLGIASLGYYFYTSQLHSKEQTSEVEAKVSRILQSVNDKNMKVLQFFLKNDKELADAYEIIQDKLDVRDQETANEILVLASKFYRAYTKLLIEQMNIKTADNSVKALVDHRIELLKKLHFLYVKYPQVNQFDLERSILVIQAATYKCLNVIKHKFHDKDYITTLPPYAANQNNSSFEI